MGGKIGQTFAQKYPGIFQSVVLADTTSRRAPDEAMLWGERIRVARDEGMEPLVQGTLARWFTEPYRNLHKGIMMRIAGDIRNTPPADYISCCEAISRVDLTDRLCGMPLTCYRGRIEHWHAASNGARISAKSARFDIESDSFGSASVQRRRGRTIQCRDFGIPGRFFGATLGLPFHGGSNLVPLPRSTGPMQ